MGSENGAPATATGRATASPPRGQLHKERLLQTVQATRSHINILVATQPREPACNRDPPSHTTPSSAHSGSGLTARRVSTFTSYVCASRNAATPQSARAPCSDDARHRTRLTRHGPSGGRMHHIHMRTTVPLRSTGRRRSTCREARYEITSLRGAHPRPRTDNRSAKAVRTTDNAESPPHRSVQ